MDRLVSIGDAAKPFPVTTLRRWERRRVDPGAYLPEAIVGDLRCLNLNWFTPWTATGAPSPTLVCPVTTRKQTLSVRSRFWSFTAPNRDDFEVVSDLGSGMNYNKRGQKNLFEVVLNGRVKWVGDNPQGQIVALRAELVFAIRSQKC